MQEPSLYVAVGDHISHLSGVKGRVMNMDKHHYTVLITKSASLNENGLFCAHTNTCQLHQDPRSLMYQHVHGTPMLWFNAFLWSSRDYTINYDKRVNRDSELPLHILKCPLVSWFWPKLGYTHPMTFHTKKLSEPIVTLHSVTPLPEDLTAQQEPALHMPDYHESQLWLFESTHSYITKFKFCMSATGSFEKCNGQYV
ncbi:hypothetical protein Moror_15343 [Moniliophthora roreri MCA 2997]|uniref:Uncharacterized protein n=1 Tax=Moniliophthora roreri (strain MCA 2997) TaxID=1381753 RepID=V2WLT0_MONRO|nr:hypothetical protein Moror_15343 [Moniliophthora roreri MCA 2997]